MCDAGARSRRRCAADTWCLAPPALSPSAPPAIAAGIFCSGECKWSYSLSGPVLISPAKDLELRPQRAAHPTAAVPEGVPARGYAVAQRPEGGQF